MIPPQALARKWRPRTFSELVGQDHVVRALSNALGSGRLHHAYLFTGTRGVGKTTLARILAKCLNCDTGLTAQPCGKCAACQSIDNGRFPDLLEVDAATNTKVEEMRELLDNAQYMPVSGRYKVYIIDEVHMLSRSAFNSMLKTLEEPPEHVKFILATTDPQKVPVTVLSRCLQFNLRALPADLIASRLAHVLRQEGIDFEEGALVQLAQAAQGSMRDSLSLLDQAVAFGGGRIRSIDVAEMLGTIEQTVLLDMLQALAARDGAGLMQGVQTMAERSFSFDRALQDMAGLLHQLTLMQMVPALRDDGQKSEALGRLANCWDGQTLQLLYQIALQSRQDLPLAPDETAGFRMALLRMLAFQPGVPESGVSVQQRPGLPAEPSLPSAGGSSGDATVPAASSHSKTLPPSLEDWAGLTQQLKGAGMAYELARHVELTRYGNGTFHLLLEAQYRHLLPYREKLRTALEALLDADVRLVIDTGAASGQSIAAVENQVQEDRQKKAEASIRSDPFVLAVTESLGAKLVESTIQPTNGHEQGETR